MTHSARCTECKQVYDSVHPKTKNQVVGERCLCPGCVGKLLGGGNHAVKGQLSLI